MKLSHLIGNRFTINDPEKDLLGRGGMGEVYRAIDTQTGETVAVKALNADILSRDPSLLERFVREGETLRQLNHSNIVHMISAMEEEGRHYLAMEFVEGGSLRDLLASRGCLPASEVIKIALEVADALTRAHHLKIIHRDLKPANVLIAKDGTPRLADFGIAHIESDQHLTQSGMLMGTVDYLSPEICQGEPPNERSDIWAFGVMLFEMLSGKLPFEGRNFTTKITSILTQPIPDLTHLTSNMPDALVDLVYRMLEKDSRQRISSVRLVGAELESMLKGREPVTPSRASRETNRFATPTPAANVLKHNLPTQVTPFVGREAELLELSRLLADPDVRLVTILGVGGMGKTRLSLEAGAAQLNNYPNGVYFVPLAPLDSVEGIIPVMAQALGLSFYEGGEPRQQLLDYLRGRSVLLIMDNFEHLLSTVDLVSEILNAAPLVKILSTSRSRLNVQGEQLFRLGGMEFSDRETPAAAMEYSAVKLFQQSASRACLNFELTTANLKSIARICELVEGMPLGILLAASWVEMLSPEEIAKEIEKNLDFLETEQRDMPDRQQSIRAVFDYSWKLLTTNEQDVFKRLSVFRGGFTREAAQQVTDASLRELMALVNKSLLQRNSSGRYEIHELLRQYGAESLLAAKENERVHQQHLEYFINMAQAAEPHLRFGAQQVSWLDFLDEEQDNLRAALEWSLKNNVNAAQQLAGALWWFWHLRAHVFEGYQWINKILALGDDVPLVRATLFGKAGQQAFVLNHQEDAKTLSEKSVAMFRTLGYENEQANPLLVLGILASYKMDISTARNLIEKSCALFKNAQDGWGLKKANDMLGLVVETEGDYEQAMQIYLESYNIASELGDKDGVGYSLIELGRVFLKQNDCKQALQHFERSLSLAREAKAVIVIIEALDSIGFTLLLMGDFEKSKLSFEECLELCEGVGIKAGAARTFRYLGLLARLEEDYPKAMTMYKKSLSIIQESEGTQTLAENILGVALTMAKQGDLVNAIRLFGAVRKVIPVGYDDLLSLDRTAYDQIVADARSALGEDVFTTSWNEGFAMSLGRVIELAMKDDEFK